VTTSPRQRIDGRADTGLCRQQLQDAAAGDVPDQHQQPAFVVGVDQLQLAVLARGQDSGLSPDAVVADGDRRQRSTGKGVRKGRAGGQIHVRRTVRIGVLRDRGSSCESVGTLPAHHGRPVDGYLLRDRVAEGGSATEQGDAGGLKPIDLGRGLG